jgi:nucleoside phosphorylase
MLSRNDYTVACICPMGHELAPVRALLDKTHPDLQTSRDQNGYVLGEIGGHNVVIAVMPEIGNNCAAMTATQLLNDFPSVRFGLLVGIGGGIPDEEEDGNDIRLGDIVVSKPTGGLGGVVQYDRGKSTIHGFEQTITLTKPPAVLLAAVEKLISQHEVQNSRVPQYLHEMLERYPKMMMEYAYPGADHDQLFRATYNHPSTDYDQSFEATYTHQTNQDCGGCDRSQLIIRKERHCKDPRIHYGIIGSANIVLKNAAEREELRRRLKVTCVEMEAAGLMETFPCLVIRGICDYADSHKNKKWQRYAAAAAAAYMKELLITIPRQGVERQVKLIDVVEVSQISDLLKLSDISENIRMKEHSKMMHWLSSVNFWGKQVDLFERAQRGTGRWIFEDERFKSWLTGPPRLLWCQGDAGVGKTILSAIIIDHLSSTLKSKDIGIAWLYIDYRERDLQTLETLFTNLLVQLLKQRGEISKSMMKSLGFNWEGAKPTPAEYRSWLQEEILKFDRTIVIIDALDELRTKELCKQFINELQSLSPPIHLLVTSRPDRELHFLRRDSTEIEVQPREDDVVLYIECRLKNSRQLWDHILADPSLKELTIEMLTKANDRM